MEKLKNILPLNWGLLSNPINWVIVVLMVVFAIMALNFVFPKATMEKQES